MAKSPQKVDQATGIAVAAFMITLALMRKQIDRRKLTKKEALEIIAAARQSLSPMMDESAAVGSLADRLLATAARAVSAEKDVKPSEWMN